MAAIGSSRQYISALSILAVAVLIGIPVWWKTTEVYRCPLPYHDIIHLASQPVPPEISMNIHISSLSISSTDVQSLVTRLQQEVSGSSVTSRGTRVKVKYNIQYKETDSSFLSSLNETLTLEELSSFLPLSSNMGTYKIILVPLNLLRDSDSVNNVYVSADRHALLATGNDVSKALPSIVYLIRSVYGNKQPLEQVLTSTHHDKVDLESRRQLRASSGYQLSFSLIVPDPRQLITSWNIEEATQNILLPFLQSSGVSSLANFSISSQVFHYTDVKLRPRKTGNLNFVPSTQLPPVISIVESKLASHVSQLPALNFVVYVSTPSQCPLLIKSPDPSDNRGFKTTDTFLVPQWGGLIIYNHPDDIHNNSTSVHVKMDHLMLAFIEQLKMLLGVPPNMPQTELINFSHGRLGITNYQVDQLLMAKMIEGVSMATSSLISLVQLLDKVKNMVISDHIQKQVETSLHAIIECYKLSSEGQLEAAYHLSCIARDSAEIAFFDPSILELLYFPDDQKFAIYIPLFLPISVPILLSSAAAIKWITTLIRSTNKQKTE